MSQPARGLEEVKTFRPYVAPEANLPELTLKSIGLGAFFGLVFGAATVYLALKAGLTVSASIPIAVMAISLGRMVFRTNILENNIIQTAGSAGESIAAGVVFTLPGFLFLSIGENGQSVGFSYFNYWTIFTLALLGGMLGTLMMVPLRRSLIVKEHGVLPYPEGTACASVLIAGEKGGKFALTAYMGLGFAFVYAFCQKIFKVIVETAGHTSQQTNRIFPSATINADITPEYMGVGYIIGPRIAGVLVAGGVLAWLGLIPLLASLVPADTIALQLEKLGYLKNLATAGGPGGWNPETHSFANTAVAVYRAYVRQIGAGAVATGGFITLLKTLPTIVSSFRDSLASVKEKSGQSISRTERDLSIKTVIIGSLALVVLCALLPMIPGNSLIGKLFLGLLIVVFGFFFVTVASRIVGIIGSSSNPISGMTIATLMGTCLIFALIGWTGSAFEPMALVVGGMVCIAAANGGATSQDLKTGYIVGATPRLQQISLFVGAIASALIIGLTIKILDTPTPSEAAAGMVHMIGSDKYPAPQGTLMATLIKGLLSFNLDWSFVLVGAFLAITMELCGVKALSFAVGAYLPLSTTLPIFAGGAIKGLVDWVAERKGEPAEESELGSGSLFATGLVAGGALMGVVVAALAVNSATAPLLGKLDLEGSFKAALSEGGMQIFGVICFAIMGLVLYRVARKPLPRID